MGFKDEANQVAKSLAESQKEASEHQATMMAKAEECFRNIKSGLMAAAKTGKYERAWQTTYKRRVKYTTLLGMAKYKDEPSIRKPCLNPDDELMLSYLAPMCEREGIRLSLAYETRLTEWGSVRLFSIVNAWQDLS